MSTRGSWFTKNATERAKMQAELQDLRWVCAQILESHDRPTPTTNPMCGLCQCRLCRHIRPWLGRNRSGPEEVNPEHPVVQLLHDKWHVVVAIIIHKLKLPEILITEADVDAYERDHADDSVMARDAEDGLHLMMVTAAQAEKLAKLEREEGRG